ncbi:glycosyltransferase family 4 protein [Maribacter spongiicola]|nr:glycosyltransferase family 1 protein [Maribacter spongiicola]
MKIIYFFRHPKIGHSIHRVFRTLVNELEKTSEINIYEMPYLGSMPNDLLNNNIYTFKKRDTKAIHHVTGHIHDVLLALFGVKTVLTIHDLVFLDNVKNPIKRCYKWLFWLYLPVKIADKVVCISNETKQNILNKIKADNLTVIHNAVDPIFTYSPKNFNEEKPIILHIGTGWNKNLNMTIEALADINCHLRIIGKLNEIQLNLLEKFKVEYSCILNLTDEEIRQEYINCDIVNFPSIYEGFGMPVIEGQQTGRVVVTSKIEPIVEVAGNAAAFVTPNNIISLKEAYIEIIKNPIYRENLVKDGLKNAKRFSIKNISKQYVELYQNLIKE